MPSFETEGTLIKIFPTSVKSERFQLREFVLNIEEGNYPQEIIFQFTQDSCDLLDKFKEGEKVKVSSWIRGKKWQRSPQDEPRWFNSLAARSIEHSDPMMSDMNQDTAQSGSGDNPFAGDIPPPTEDTSSSSEMGDDDLPF
ncbi:DUF3127 domain-containing protein [Bernardetia sp. ABR2-2B]|uniref:DUF3127 domain-containing protein n=1 Tax=Bernardetia sp. ABR2-2B TaxID=3127472 RepID=UPI0030D34571